MVHVVLICGGTGSIAVQKGFAQLYGYRNYRLDAVINAYDNGKSTGECRRVFGGKILGPSDLRKNQLTQYKLVYEQALLDKGSYESKLLSLFELRFSADNAEGYYKKAKAILEQSSYLDDAVRDKFITWLMYFFFKDRGKEIYRATVADVNFTDFSLSNIFYASCAAMNHDSLGAAGRIMSEILHIENRVHLISDVNVFLKARTEKGVVIPDEGEIVAWGDPDDKITEDILEDEHGRPYTPRVDENNEESVSALLENADIIIFSSGTQWSSLIPTYMHDGFNDLIHRVRAKKYLIMNNEEDTDMPGLCADELLSVVSGYLDLSDVTVVLNDNAAESMRRIGGGYRAIHGRLSEPRQRVHTPAALVEAIMADYFGLGPGKPSLISDLDGTLWDDDPVRGNRDISIRNMSMFRGTILSGNNYEHVYSITKEYFTAHGGGKIYCDYGNTAFDLNSPKYETQMLSEQFVIEDGLVRELEKDENFAGKVTLRGKVIVTIKPLSDRPDKLRKVRAILQEYGGRYVAEIAGHTSIDIKKSDYSKAASLEQIIMNNGLHKEDILYVGNELTQGNDVCIQTAGVRTLQVKDVFETNLFLKTWLNGK